MLTHGRPGGGGRRVSLPVNRAFEPGPGRSFAMNPPAYDPRYHFQLAIDAGCNAYAAPLGFLEAGAARFARQIPRILKLHNSHTLAKNPEPRLAGSGSAADPPRLRGAGLGG